MAVGGCTLSSDDIVIKSPTDRRLYRYIQLQNGLCALLIHDPEIYPEGTLQPYKTSGDSQDQDQEVEDDDEEDDDDDDEEDEESEEEEDEEQEDEASEDDSTEITKGKTGASQTKQVCFSFHSMSAIIACPRKCLQLFT
ncbi:nardilysin [Sarracenia purpurea var. burkii]